MGAKKDINRQHTYITECYRNECAAIFATRTRMLGVKNNYRSARIYGLNMQMVQRQTRN